MIEYISRESVMKIYDEWFATCNIADKKESPKAKIKALPSITLQGPKKGRWIAVENARYSDIYGHFTLKEYKCSNCGSISEYGYYKYCFECGAKMEGENV